MTDVNEGPLHVFSCVRTSFASRANAFHYSYIGNNFLVLILGIDFQVSLVAVAVRELEPTMLNRWEQTGHLLICLLMRTPGSS